MPPDCRQARECPNSCRVTIRNKGSARGDAIAPKQGFSLSPQFHQLGDHLARAVPGVRDIQLAAGLCAAVLGVQLLVAAFLAPTMFGFWFPPRHLLAGLPLAIPLCAWGLRALPRLGTVLAALTLAASVWLFPTSAAILTWHLLRPVTTVRRTAAIAATAAALSASFTSVPYIEFGVAAMPNLAAYGAGVTDEEFKALKDLVIQQGRRLDQLEQVQRDVGTLLEHGLNPPAPAEAVVETKVD